MKLNLGIYLKINRIKKGKSMIDVINEGGLNFSQAYLSMIETNKKIPSKKLLRSLAIYYSIPIKKVYSLAFKRELKYYELKLKDKWKI